MKNMTKETDKISVIVPVYNVKNYLESCVQSIMGQTYPDLEILLIDDGSNDGSAEICDRLQGADARIKVYHEQTAIVADFYAKQGKFADINGLGTMDEVFDRICQVIDSIRK